MEMSLELRSLVKNARLNADGSENRTLTVSLKGFESDSELQAAYKTVERKLVGWINKEVYGQTELPTEEEGNKRRKK
ncbi:MAG: hypothetical protein ACREBS_00445 [Nitrososphaerales archaeon]